MTGRAPAISDGAFEKRSVLETMDKENSQHTLGFFKYLFNLMYLDAPHNVTVSVFSVSLPCSVRACIRV